MGLGFDIAIFLLFLLINLAVGISYGKKVRNIKDYALGGRNFSTAALVATIVATALSGSGFFITLSHTYNEGLYHIIPAMGMSVSILLTAYFLIPRMESFLGCTSVAEAMGDLYGKEVRFITAIAGILWSIGGIAVQFKVFGNIFNYFLGIQATYALFLASAIVILYSISGGIRAVTYTDVVQFVTFGFVIPLIGVIVWNSAFKLNVSITDMLRLEQFDFKQVLDFNNPKMLAMLPLFVYFAFPSVDPTYFQRIAMGSNTHQLKVAWAISGFLLLVLKLLLSWIPFLVKAINPELDPSEIVYYIADNYSFTGLKGLIIIGIAAMAMSTADSRINASSVLFGNDIAKPLKLKIDNLAASKWFALIWGGMALYLAMYNKDLLSTVMIGAGFYMVTVSVPLVASILGFRTTKNVILASMLSGISAMSYQYIVHSAGSDVAIFSGTIASTVGLFSVHYILRAPGGWIGNKNTKYTEQLRRKKRLKISDLFHQVQKFNFFEFCKQKAPKNELTYMWLGLYFILFTITTMYSTHHELLRDSHSIILISYQIMMITGVVIAMYPIWPAKIKNEIVIQIGWLFAIFYMLIFFTYFFVLVSGFASLQLIVFALNTMIAAVLIGWRTGLFLTIFGFYVSVKFFKYYANLSQIAVDIDSMQVVFVFSLLLVGSVLIIFFKPQQEEQALLSLKNDHLSDRLGFQEEELRKAFALKGEFIRNVNHEYHASMTGISTMANILRQNYDKLNEVQKKQAIDTIIQNSVRLEVFDANLSSLSVLSKKNYKLNLEPINFGDLVYDRVESCSKFYDGDGKREFEFDIADQMIIKADKYYLTQLLDNLIINSINYCSQGKIHLSAGPDNKGVKFVISDEGLGIPPKELVMIFEEFTVSTKTQTPAGYRGVGLALCKRIVEVHKGHIFAESDGIKGSKFTFYIDKE